MFLSIQHTQFLYFSRFAGDVCVYRLVPHIIYYIAIALLNYWQRTIDKSVRNMGHLAVSERTFILYVFFLFYFSSKTLNKFFENNK